MGSASSAIDPERYAVLGLTHVQYDPTDPFAKLLALVTLSPIFLLCSYVTIILYRRELTFVNALIGQLGCEGLNWGLKRLIRQPRPTNHLGKGYGMPSSHSQFLGFFCSFFMAHFLLHHPRASKPATLVNTMRRLEHWIAMACILGLTAATCYSRLHLSYHSTAQVAVGLTVGLAVGAFYYYLTEYLPRQPLRLPVPLGSPVINPSANTFALYAKSSAVSGSRDVSADHGNSPTRQRKRSEDGRSKSSGTSRSSAHRHGRRRSSMASLMPELHPAPPLRQLILDHPLAVAFRLRDSWTVWLDGGIEGEYEAWRREWELRRPSTQVLDHQCSISELSRDAKISEISRTSALTLSPTAETGFNTASGWQGVAPDVTSAIKRPKEHSQGNLQTASTLHYSVMLRALYLASQCPPTSTAFCVGCVVTERDSDRALSTGFSRETGDKANEHAEQVALRKLQDTAPSAQRQAADDEQPIDLDLYTTMEPCSERLSGALPCVQRITRFNEQQRSSSRRPAYRITRVFQALSEPADFITDNTSAALLKDQGIELVVVSEPQALADASTGSTEREALRLAKQGHPDQPTESPADSAHWREAATRARW